MDPFVTWLTSTFGDQAPSIAAGMGVPPPQPFPDVSLGASLNPTGGTGVPLPQPRPMAPGPVDLGTPTATGGGIVGVGPTEASAQATPAAAAGNPLTSALRGMVAPTVPTPQRLSTPAAPRLNDIKGGEILQLLLAAGEGGMQGGRKLQPMPSTLGQALSVPRY